MSKTILLHKLAYDRVKADLPDAAKDCRFATIDEDGTARLDGKEVAIDTLTADGAWMSIDFLRNEASKVFAGHVLASDTVRWMQTAAAGLDHPFFQNALKKGITISNSDAQAPAIAEFVMAQVLAHYQPTVARAEAQKAHRWERLAFREISDQTWMIVGFGHIGMEIAKRARGFDAHVIGIRRTPGDHLFADEMAPPDLIPNLLPVSDVVVLACPLTDATHQMANGAFFKTMKEGTTFVNIGRGGLVNEADLLAGLEEGKPDFAILDVFDTEPLPGDSPFWDHPKVAVSGHTSAFGSGTRTRGDRLFLENLKKFLNGERLRNQVDPTRL